MVKIYFDKDKNAVAEDSFMKERAICIIDESEWRPYAGSKLGEDYDIIDNRFVKLRSEEELIFRENTLKRISELKMMLSESDYITLKYTEGEISEEEFKEAKLQREQWREEIRRLEELLKSAKSK